MFLKSVDITSTFKTKSGQLTSNAAENLKRAILGENGFQSIFRHPLFQMEDGKTNLISVRNSRNSFLTVAVFFS